MLTFLPIGHPIVPIARIGLDVIVASFFRDRTRVRLCLPVAFQREAIEALAESLGYDASDIRRMAFDEEPVDDHLIRRIVDIGKSRPLSDRALVTEMMKPGKVHVHSGSIGTLVVNPNDDRLTLSLGNRSADIPVSGAMPRYIALYRTMIHMASSDFDPSDLMLTARQVDVWIDERIGRSLFAYDLLVPGEDA